MSAYRELTAAGVSGGGWATHLEKGTRGSETESCVSSVRTIVAKSRQGLTTTLS